MTRKGFTYGRRNWCNFFRLVYDAGMLWCEPIAYFLASTVVEIMDRMDVIGKRISKKVTHNNVK